MIINLILFVIVILLMTILFPLSGYHQSKLIKNNLVRGLHNKTDWYKKSALWSWIPVAIILPVIYITGYTLTDLGFRLPSKEHHNVSSLLFFVSLAAAAIYLLYNIYCIISFRFSEKIREHHASKIPSSIKLILPVTKEEKQVWVFLSFTAGVTEEILYRGYLFFIFPLLFPELSFVYIISVSVLLFGTGHLYQGKEVIKPALAGLFLSLIFYFTGSLPLVIVLHIVQDLVARELL